MNFRHLNFKEAKYIDEQGKARTICLVFLTQSFANGGIKQNPLA